jgi:hypothetical protein
VRVDARHRLYRVDLARLAEVRTALDELWGGALDNLKHTAESQRRPAKRTRSA